MNPVSVPTALPCAAQAEPSLSGRSNSSFLPFRGASYQRRLAVLLHAFLLSFAAGPSLASQGQSLVQDEQGWVYVDERGKPIVRPFIYDNGPDYFEEGLARFVSEGKMGFFDQALTIQIPARYDFAFPFVEGKAKVGMDCQLRPQGEHHLVRCQQWEMISNPLRKQKNRPLK